MNRMPLAIYIFSLCAFSLGFTEFVSIGLVSTIANDMHINVAEVGTAVTAYAFGVVLGAPILTALTGNWSRKYLLFSAMLVFSLANLAVGFSSTFTMVLIARFVSGLAHGVFFAVAASTATELVGVKRSGAALALVFGGLTIAMAFAVPLGTYLGSLFSWRIIFIIIALCGGIGVLGLLIFMPNITQKTPRSPRKNLQALMNPKLLAGAGVTMLTYCGAFTLYTYISPLLLEVTLISVQNLSFMMLIYGCAAAVGNIVGGKMTDKLGVDSSCLAIIVSLMVVLFLIGFSAQSFILIGILIALLGGISYAAVPALQTRLIHLAQQHEPESVAVISGLNIAGFNLGITFGSLLGSATILLTHDVTLTAFVGAFIAAIGGYFLLLQMKAKSKIVLNG